MHAKDGISSKIFSDSLVDKPEDFSKRGKQIEGNISRGFKNLVIRPCEFVRLITE